MSDICLTELRKEDCPILLKWINDRHLVISNNNYNPIHELNHEDWFKSIIKDFRVRIFAIRTLNDDKLIGTCQLSNIDFVNRNAELQIRIGNEGYRGKGVGQKVVKQIVEYGFDDLGLHRIYLRVFVTNEIAIHVYKKIGFQVEGTLRHSSFIDGKFIDELIMSILNNNE